MATPPDSPIDEALFELEPSRVPKHRPVALEDLCRQTKFTRQEIRVMYRGFKQVSRMGLSVNCTECPEGVVHEDSFKDIYAKFFPHGNSSLYAHYVFKAFDVNSNGAISFRDLLVTLSTLLRGSIYEKLRWTFKLYDINGDGCITRAELAEIVVAIHELMGRRAHQVEDDRKAREQVDRVFKKLDLNQDGVITIEEFIESCLKVEISLI
ncbi:Kv channel-interacting protein 1 [Zootermopsis nevadensis]|uniref:Kv channel-interacting protein 1 n=1 Tax=Zootermopsis nevadensis TaxID=136037 RepID=A0A067R1S6_ZOONE|nr:Kv channel-interacting protein 1 [Zootermopsis nevadensis]